MELSLHIFLLLFSVAFISGIISSVTASPAIILLPAMMLTGLPTYSVLGTQKLYNSISLLTSSIYFLQKKVFCIRFWLLTLIAAIIGSIMGVTFVHIVSSIYFLDFLPMIITIVAIGLLFHNKLQSWLDHRLKQTKPKSFLAFSLAIIVGIYSGLFGSGTGPLWTLITTTFFKISLKQASALSCFFSFITNVSALVIFMVLKEVNYPLGLSLSVCGALGSIIGSKLLLLKNDAFIQKALLCITFIMAIILVFKPLSID